MNSNQRYCPVSRDAHCNGLACPPRIVGSSEGQSLNTERFKLWSWLWVAVVALAPLLTLVGEIGLLGLRLNPVQWTGFAVVLLAVLGLARRA